MPRLLDDPVAHWLVVTTAVATVIGEIVATYLGHARDGERRLRGSLADSLLLYVHGRGTALRRDRGTRLIVALTVYLGIAAALQSRECPLSVSTPTTGGRSDSGSGSFSWGPHFVSGRS